MHIKHIFIKLIQPLYFHNNSEDKLTFFGYHRDRVFTIFQFCISLVIRFDWYFSKLKTYNKHTRIDPLIMNLVLPINVCMHFSNEKEGIITGEHSLIIVKPRLNNGKTGETKNLNYLYVIFNSDVLHREIV